MGEIIPWPKRERPAERSRLATEGERGRVLLFLGVRYERHADAAPWAHPEPDCAGDAPVSGAERGGRTRRRG